MDVPADGRASGACFLDLGERHEDVARLASLVRARGCDAFVKRTSAYWKLWVARDKFDYAELPPAVVQLFLRSQLILRTQIDKRGAILAANDHDITSYARDTYSYVWPRDGALVAAALDMVGHV